MSEREKIAKRMMFAVANLINNEDDSRLPELTTEYWEAAVDFHAEFAHEPTVNALVNDRLEMFENALQQ